MKILSTTIKAGAAVEIIIGDESEESPEMVSCTVLVPVEERRPLAELQLTALDRARTILTHEIEAIKRIRGRQG